MNPIIRALVSVITLGIYDAIRAAAKRKEKPKRTGNLGTRGGRVVRDDDRRIAR